MNPVGGAQAPYDPQKLGELLVRAVSKGDVPETQRLINSKADLNQVVHGKTALQVAASRDNPSMVYLLVRKGMAAEDALFDARPQAILLLLAEGVNPNVYRKGISPLHRMDLTLCTASALLLAKADINQRTMDDCPGRTPLMTCPVGLCEYMIRNQADLHAKCDAGNSVLHHRLKMHTPPALTAFLLSLDADPNSVGEGGVSPLMLSLGDFHDFNAVELLKAGADPNHVDAHGLDCLHYVSYDRINLMFQLCKYGYANSGSLHLNQSTRNAVKYGPTRLHRFQLQSLEEVKEILIQEKLALTEPVVNAVSAQVIEASMKSDNLDLFHKARLILLKAKGWCPEAHCVFSARRRKQAVFLAWVGKQLACSKAGMGDIWPEVMRMAV